METVNIVCGSTRFSDVNNTDHRTSQSFPSSNPARDRRYAQIQAEVREKEEDQARRIKSVCKK